jgi:hypothetical protein
MKKYKSKNKKFYLEIISDDSYQVFNKNGKRIGFYQIRVTKILDDMVFENYIVKRIDIKPIEFLDLRKYVSVDKFPWE